MKKTITVELSIPRTMPSADACSVLGALLKNAHITIEERKGPSLTVKVPRSSPADLKAIKAQLEQQHINIRLP